MILEIIRFVTVRPFTQSQFTASGHVTKVYFYSNNSESHYQSPSSLPVYSSVTKINTATGNSSRHERGHTHTHTLTIPDSGGRAVTNKSKSSSITKLLPELFRYLLLYSYILKIHKIHKIVFFLLYE